MPAQYDLPRSTQTWSVQDQNLYQKYPFYLANLTAKEFPIWHVWEKLYGSRSWQANEGTTLRGVQLEASPVGRQVFFPNPITQAPLRDVHLQLQRIEEAVLYRHNYESPYIPFLAPFQDFHKDHIPRATKNLAAQIAIANDQFVRTMIFHKAAFVMICGKGVTAAGDGFDGEDFLAAPSGIGNSAGTAAKTTAWLQQALAYVDKNLSYKQAKRAVSIFQEDVQAPAFSGMQSMPKDNDTIKGQYLFIGSTEAYEYFEFDEYVQSHSTYNKIAQDSEFSGKVGSKGLWKCERFPLRIADDGTFPAPQLYEANPDAYNYGETIPNPAYNNTKFEVAFLCGGGAYETIKVGPPPKEFASGSMNAKKFAELRWNGEVRLTDNLLINVGTAAAPQLTTNKYGEFVQLFADTVHGIIPQNRRFVVPIVYRRARVND